MFRGFERTCHRYSCASQTVKHSPISGVNLAALDLREAKGTPQKQGRPVQNQRSGQAERLRNTRFHRLNGANGMSDIEGKATRAGASERGQRTSFKTPRYRGKAKVDLQNQFIGAACNIKRWLRLLAEQIRPKAPENSPPTSCGRMELAFCGS